MKRKIRAIGMVLSLLFLTACKKNTDDILVNQELEQKESIITEAESINAEEDPITIEAEKIEQKNEKDSIRGFIQGKVKAYRDDDKEGFYLQDITQLIDEEDSDYFNYSLGEMLDIDNDEEDELIINGPYGGMYLDCVDDKVEVFAEGEGTAVNLSYVYYDNAYWIVYSDTTHTGRIMHTLTKYNGSKTIADSFNLSAEFYNTEYEEGDFYYRDEAITKEKFEELCNVIWGNEDSIELPPAYEEILEHCKNIINKVETEKIAYPEEEDGLVGYTDAVLHAGISKEDFCYSYTDLNDDGIMELILANRCNDENGGSLNYKAGYTLINIFTLEENVAVSLVDANFHSNWYINADKEIINESQSNPAWYNLSVYSFEKDGELLKEKYSLYNKYLENNKDVGQYERINGGDEVLTEKYDSFNNDDLWRKYMEVLNQYTENLYELDLVSICEE